jgi:hypothetical protein
MGIIGVGLSMLLECNWLGQKSLLKILISFGISLLLMGIMAMI